MTYITSIIKIGLGIQKLIGEDTRTHRQRGDLISLCLFFHNKELSLKMVCCKRSEANAKTLWNCIPLVRIPYFTLSPVEEKLKVFHKR
jgi:hypothetical protein